MMKASLKVTSRFVLTYLSGILFNSVIVYILIYQQMELDYFNFLFKKTKTVNVVVTRTS